MTQISENSQYYNLLVSKLIITASGWSKAEKKCSPVLKSPWGEYQGFFVFFLPG